MSGTEGLAYRLHEGEDDPMVAFMCGNNYFSRGAAALTETYLAQFRAIRNGSVTTEFHAHCMLGTERGMKMLSNQHAVVVDGDIHPF